VKTRNEAACGSGKTRRVFLSDTTQLSAALAAGFVGLLGPANLRAEKKEETEVTPAEDLMREHGLLNRVLLIYEEFLRRIAGQADFDPGLLAESAGIIHSFIEDYHEKLEENYLFPRFEKARKLVDLVKTLRAQHQAGRRLTERILQIAKPSALKEAADRRSLQESLHQFIRMYRPHEAREDTVLFPALHEIVSPHEYGALGEEFEDKEHQLLGDEGFEKMVGKVVTIEKRMGIFELSQFTPKVMI
jgi:hemerythrin-like domain-containing protein